MSNCVLKADVEPLVQSEAPASNELLPQIASAPPSFDLRLGRTSWEGTACDQAFGNKAKSGAFGSKEQFIAELERMSNELGPMMVAGKLQAAETILAELTALVAVALPRLAPLIERVFGKATELGTRTPNPDPIVQELNAALRARSIEPGPYGKLITKVNQLADEVWHAVQKTKK